jgi:hypothetical protein
MANVSLIIGESGTGKSTSIHKLDPKETFIINIIDKPLPFRGYRENYKKLSSDGATGNYYASDSYSSLVRVIRLINAKRPDIKTLIIDDFQYVMCNEFMRRAKETGFGKFTEIGHNAWSIANELIACRDSLDCFVLSHSEYDSQGYSKCKTIGKMLDEKITFEGMFTLVLHTLVVERKYMFLTDNDGLRIAKSPMGLFDSLYIDNDLQMVKERLAEYYGNHDHGEAA